MSDSNCPTCKSTSPHRDFTPNGYCSNGWHSRPTEQDLVRLQEEVAKIRAREREENDDER